MKSKPANIIIEPKASPELKASVKRSIDEILKGGSPSYHRELANLYLEHKECFPFSLKSDFGKHIKEFIENLVSSGAITAEALKPIEDDFWIFWRGIFEEMKGRMSKLTIDVLEMNYDKETIDRILAVLVDFELFLERPDILDIKTIKRYWVDRKKQYENVIKGLDFLLRKALLSDSEREIVEKIKVKHDFLLKVHSIRKKDLDPLKETLLNLSARTTLLSGKEGWTEEYLNQCCATAFTSSTGRPKSLFDKALMVVIYRLLESNKQFRRKYYYTAKIVQCCKGIDKVNPKDIENALHT